MIDYPKYKKVLFCTDFSENSDFAFNYAFGVAKRDESTLYILHVLPENPNLGYLNNYLDTETLERIQKGVLEDVAHQFRERYLDNIGNEVKYETVTKSGRQAREIVEFAKDEGVDLIVMGTHGTTGIEHVFFGSVAQKVIQRSPLPVFVIPCEKKLEELKR